ncbi:glycosyltransferase family 39 protein [Acidipropionibacterium virtanenii]|uniref:Undecaprenyl phosphate-alpha-4-amino-4-deoxy-L-arabinose arabinosyl transferase n=1 Tax=Acidipropionibacterium virtanenii TaxID=2057246 RepID=A0A344UPW2_9ACTN|nr:glycosyltransferase family 39 protein [Acidipropionibacterium virtanenii]AXE37310.1 Undecaprenyl phosphate-alpha-4-amino-4-deoxy-L-arabinose arabinosyl transferase [Acidipropionibacterium virtanenii]
MSTTARLAPTLRNSPGAITATAPTRDDRAVGSWWTGRGFRGVSLAALLAAVGCLYIIGLSASGWANSFYSAAAQAGSLSWKALFFGSSDAANFITVDKPPAFLWIIGLSVRSFGVNSWAILVPEALEGVAAVAVLYFTIRRVLARSGFRDVTPATNALHNHAHWAAMAGALVFALTPSATLMFRYNNPDALLVLLLVISAYCTLRASEKAEGQKGARKWLILAGVAVGFGFLTKMMQALLVLPALVVAYAVASRRSWGRKILDLLAALVAMVVAAGWYIAIFELVPASSRPYMGGTQTNSFLELVFGYNGFGRITGNETGAVVPGGTGAGSWGSTGLTRLFIGTSVGMVTWLIPAALILAGVAVALLGRGAWRNLTVPFSTVPFRSSGRRAGQPSRADARSAQTLAGLIVMAGTMVVTYLTFTYMAGIYHDYYTVALTPWIGGTVALGAAVCWRRRRRLVARIGLAVATLATSAWAIYLLSLAGGAWMWLAGIAGVAGLAGATLLLLADRVGPALARTGVILALVAALTGPTGYSINTASTAHTGAIITAGPVSGGMGGGQGRPGGGQGGGPGGQGSGRRPGTTTGTQNQQAGARTGGMGGGGGMGGLNGDTQVSSAAKTLLSADASSYTWVAATIGSNTAAGYQLATGYPVMAIGGYNGTDNAPTLAQFKQLVAQHKIHYYIAGDSGGMGGGQTSSSSGSSAASEITAWVKATYSAKTVGSTTVYDLTSSAS